MRVTTLSRAGLGQRSVRLDPAFYLGRERVRATIRAEGSRHVRLLDLVESIQDGARLPAATAGIAMLRLTNIRPCELDLSGLTPVDGTAANWVRVQPNDVLFTRAAQPFRAAVVPPGIPAELAAASELAIVRPRPAVLPEYLAAVLCTPTLNRTLRDLAYRGQASALPRLRLSDIARLPIPLPPRSLQASLRHQYRQALDLTARARAEIDAVVAAIHAEIDYRVGTAGAPPGAIALSRSALPDRWDVPFNRGRVFRQHLAASPAMQPLLHLATPSRASLRGLAAGEAVFVVQADDLNAATLLVESGERRPLADPGSRLRRRLAVGDVLLCTTGAGEQVAYLDAGLDSAGRPILGSATFTVLHFSETPRVFAVALTHRLVREQLRLLASGSVQRFVNQRDLDDLLVPVLGPVWRQDFESRLARAMQHRREALDARSALIETADRHLRETIQ